MFVGLQPPRGFGENPISVYHSPDLTPTHHYIAYYRWIRDVFRADAMVHVGKHGTLEWLPGKGIGLSEACYPEVALQDLPLFYPFIINNPGEGTQAKRRTHATIIDHLIPPMTTADSYGDIAKLEQLMDEHYQCQTLDPAKLPMLEGQIWEMVQQAELHRDLGVEAQPDDFGEFMLEIDGYLCEIKDVQIKDGLHTLGQPPTEEQLVGLLSALTRLDISGIPSLRRALAEALDLDYAGLLDDPGRAVNGSTPAALLVLDQETPVRSAGDIIERLELLCRSAYEQLQVGGFQGRDVPDIVAGLLGHSDPATELVLRYVTDSIYPALMRTSDEVGNLLRGLDGRFVPPGAQRRAHQGHGQCPAHGPQLLLRGPQDPPVASGLGSGQGPGRRFAGKIPAGRGQLP